LKQKENILTQTSQPLHIGYYELPCSSHVRTYVISHDPSIATTTHHLLKDKIHSHLHIKFIIVYRKPSIHIFFHFICFLLQKKTPKITTITHQNYIYHQTKLKNPLKGILKKPFNVTCQFRKMAIMQSDLP
jgi:hypothetical protein